MSDAKQYRRIEKRKIVVTVTFTGATETNRTEPETLADLRDDLRKRIGR